ncbi:phosphotransferase [Clostridium sp. 'deep sea']|uniref:aminoglycoside phosphotransferase family protein n=1 Tax=Clostridium sp. 'deep sea' TaxID=2779445 RepID=UPI00189657D5|nr:aminoglycoside phosphotransferase family protein [Clostridium sp. 'deep sea']QOR35522.1 phosphotransferase [Clostridium sp. 'deep sea']
MNHKLLGELVGKGRCAEVYNYGLGRVIKLFNNDFDIKYIEQEFSINKIINDLNISAPKAYSIESVNQRMGIVYDKVDGTTLTSTIFDNSKSIHNYGELMAKLHLSIHSCKAASLPDGLSRFKNKILRQQLLSDYVKNELIEVANTLPNEDTLCHSDFHFDNIMRNNEELIVIDWLGAYKGYPLLDVARSYLMLLSPSIPSYLNKPVNIVNKIQKEIAETYYNYYINNGSYSINETEIVNVFRIVAVERLYDNIPFERDWLLEIIKDKKIPTIS